MLDDRCDNVCVPRSTDSAEFEEWLTRLYGAEGVPDDEINADGRLSLHTGQLIEPAPESRCFAATRGRVQCGNVHIGWASVLSIDVHELPESLL